MLHHLNLHGNHREFRKSLLYYRRRSCKDRLLSRFISLGNEERGRQTGRGTQDDRNQRKYAIKNTIKKSKHLKSNLLIVSILLQLRPHPVSPNMIIKQIDSTLQHVFFFGGGGPRVQYLKTRACQDQIWNLHERLPIP